MTQYWVVNNSPPGSGPGGAAYTSYAIVRGTEAQAEAIPNAGGISGPYSTLAAAYKVYSQEPANSNVSPITLIGQALGAGTGYAVYGDNPNEIVSAAAAGGTTAANAIPGLTDIANFFDKLGEANTWIRIGEAVLGLILIAVGVARITHAVPIATKVARTAGAVALA